MLFTVDQQALISSITTYNKATMEKQAETEKGKTHNKPIFILAALLVTLFTRQFICFSSNVFVKIFTEKTCGCFSSEDSISDSLPCFQSLNVS